MAGKSQGRLLPAFVWWAVIANEALASFVQQLGLMTQAFEINIYKQTVTAPQQLKEGII